MATWLDALVIAVMYLGGGGGIVWFLWRHSGPPRPARVRSTQLLPGLEERDLTTDSDYWGFFQ